MGGIHLGFNPSSIEKEGKSFFSNVQVKSTPEIRYECQVGGSFYRILDTKVYSHIIEVIIMFRNSKT